MQYCMHLHAWLILACHVSSGYGTAWLVTVFIDEIDALVASRSGADEHEASRRMKVATRI